MRSLLENKKGTIAELPAFFQIMLLVVVFAGLTFIVLDKFVTTTYVPTGASVANETGGYINTTGYTLDEASVFNARGFAITEAWNVTGTAAIILSGNYTVNSATGIVTNASTVAWPDVNFSYTYTYDETTTGTTAINESSNALYEYGIGFLGIIILVTMVYLIIQIISGRRRRR